VIAQYLMGLSPTTAGWSEFDIRPQTATFRKARITVPTVKGTVGLSFVKRGGKTIYTIDVPEGTTGRFFATRSSSPRLLTGGRHVLTVGE
jgi:alpha-L-rhamnosidase